MATLETRIVDAMDEFEFVWERVYPRLQVTRSRDWAHFDELLVDPYSTSRREAAAANGDPRGWGKASEVSSANEKQVDERERELIGQS